MPPRSDFRQAPQSRRRKATATVAATAVGAALAEIESRLLVMQPQHEGLRDFARLNLHEGTLREINASIAQYDRRIGLMMAAKAALEALRDDGHPDLDVREIPEAAFHDLQTNATTIAAALSQFASGAAMSMRLSPGQAEHKA
jgi:hypothetical protein